MATYAEALAGFDAGIRYGTHLFNAMPPLAHREPGLPGALLTDDRLCAGFIPDGIHTHPAIIRLAWKQLGPDRFSMVTDSMAALGMGPGRHLLGDYEVLVDDSSARLADGTLAGSILSLDQGLRNLVRETGCSLEQALATVTTTPARLLGLDASTRPDRSGIRRRPGPALARARGPSHHRPRRACLPALRKNIPPSPHPRRKPIAGMRGWGDERGDCMPRVDKASLHVYREIHEQPEVLERLLGEAQGQVDALAAEIKRRAITHVIIAGRGTSDNAARYAQYLLGAFNQLPVGLAAPSLFTIYDAPPHFGNALVLGVSQSGKSPDIVSVLAEARRQGALTAALTNFPDSDLAASADHVIALEAGEERSVAATKTYMAELAAIAMLSVALAGDGERAGLLRGIPGKVAEALEMHENLAGVAERYRYMTSCVTIGRGYNYCTAFELALKLKEMTYTVVEPYSSADFLHGPFALLAPGFPVFAVAPSGKMLPELRTFMGQVQERDAELVVISDDADALAAARVPLPLPAGVPEWLSPLPAIAVGQLFAMELAVARDLNPDQPRALHKVTETR